MNVGALRAGALLALIAAAPAPALYGPPVPPTPYDLCDDAIAAARTKAIPATLLPAIARVESGRLDPATNRIRPWPWTINVEGVGSFYDTKDDVIAAVQAFQARGIRSIDVGCMQVNLFHHPKAFPDLATAFDPPANVAYAVRFLSDLYALTRDWSLAAANYHSATQERGEEYQRRVFGRVMTPMGPPRAPKSAGPFAPPATMFGAIPPSTAMFGAIPPAASKFGAFATPPPRAAESPPELIRGSRVRQ